MIHSIQADIPTSLHPCIHQPIHSYCLFKIAVLRIPNSINSLFWPCKQQSPPPRFSILISDIGVDMGIELPTYLQQISRKYTYILPYIHSIHPYIHSSIHLPDPDFGTTSSSPSRHTVCLDSGSNLKWINFGSAKANHHLSDLSISILNIGYHHRPT